MGTANIDIIPDYLRQFASEPGLTVDTAPLTNGLHIGGFQGRMAESVAFGAALMSATEAILRFVTDVDQGFEAFKAGAEALADSYSTTEQQVTSTLLAGAQAAAARSAGSLPEVMPELGQVLQPGEG